MKKNKVESKIEELKETTSQEKVFQRIEELKELLSSVKSKFDEMDSKTKKIIIAGVAGSVALIVGAIGVNSIKNKKN